MDKQLLPSIEKFAAYLDGNLSQDEMLQFSRLAANDKDLMNLLDADVAVEETLMSYNEADLLLPKEIAGWDFELPNIEKNDDFNLVGDSFAENAPLYNQEDSYTTEKILDEVFDDEVFETESTDDVDLDVDIDDEFDDILDDINF